MIRSKDGYHFIPEENVAMIEIRPYDYTFQVYIFVTGLQNPIVYENYNTKEEALETVKNLIDLIKPKLKKERGNKL